MERHRHPGDVRPTSASLSFSTMSALMQKMPTYSGYTSAAQATAAERLFRLAMGARLKECGDRLLSIVEKRAQIMDSDMEGVIDALVERIGAIFRRLDREGAVTLVGDSAHTIEELEELDTRLILLIEETMALVHNLGTDVPAAHWFNSDAARLVEGLADFSRMTEERNYLLGLGWESEFQRKGRPHS